MTRSLRARDEITEIIAMYFTDVIFRQLYDVGIIIKPISIGSTSEQDDRADKLFKQSLTLDIRTEWERRIPIDTIINSILFSIEFQDIENNGPVAQNLTINTELTYTDLILGL